MEQSPITMELGEKIDITAIATLKTTLAQLPINAEPQLLDASHVTHIDSASCQLFMLTLNILRYITQHWCFYRHRINLWRW